MPRPSDKLIGLLRRGQTAFYVSAEAEQLPAAANPPSNERLAAVLGVKNFRFYAASEHTGDSAGQTEHPLACLLAARNAPFYPHPGTEEPFYYKELQEKDDNLSKVLLPHHMDYPSKDKYEVASGKELSEFKALSPEQKRLVAVFARALRVEQVSIPNADVDGAVEEIKDLAYSGRLLQLFERISELARMPPARAPMLRQNHPEGSPGEFIATVYFHWLNAGRIHQAIIRTLDPALAEEFKSWKRSRKAQESLPDLVRDALPTQAEFNDSLLTGKNEVVDSAERTRLSRLLSDRRRQGNERVPLEPKA